MLKTKNNAILKLAIFFLLQIFVTLIILLSGKLRYVINDDTGLIDIVSGAYGSTSAYMHLYVNIILGKILKFLFDTMPIINWYSVVMLSLTFFSFVFIALIISINDSRSNLSVFSIKVYILIFLYTVVLQNFTYTIVSYTCGISGFIAMFSALSLNSKKNKIILYTLGFIFIIFGILVRYNTIYSLLIIAVPVFLFETCRKKKIEVVLVLAISLVFTLTLPIINNAAYSNDSVWSDYADFDRARTDVLDRARVSYENHRQQFEEIGFTRNTYDCLYKWIFADKQVFSTENFKRISKFADVTQRYNFNIVSICKSIAYQFVFFYKYPNEYTVVFIFLFVMSIFLNKKQRFEIILLFLTAIGVNALFCFLQRPLFRVVFPNYMFTCIVMMLIFDISESVEMLGKLNFKKLLLRYKPILCGFAGFAFIFTYITFLLAYTRENSNVQTDDYNFTVLSYLHEHEENFYISANDFHNIKLSISFFDYYAKCYKHNFASLGGWAIYTKQYYELLERYNIQNKDRLFFALLDDEKVYYVSSNENDLNLVITYLKENTKADINIDIIDMIGDTGVKVYKFSR